MTVGISSAAIALVDDATQTLLDWAEAIAESDETYFHKAQKIARRLGAHYRQDGLTELGFWVPELAGEVIQSERTLYLEVFTPLAPIQVHEPEQTIAFRCDRLSLMQQGEYVWGVVAGMQAGTRDQIGSLYWLRYVDPQENLQTIYDVLAYSLPYGVFAPAELYDVVRSQQQRADLDYFRQTATPNLDPNRAADADAEVEIPRIPSPRNILQLHVSTASKEGTLAGLTQVYQTISDKLAAGTPLTPAEHNYIGYDAVQLLPLEPTIEYRQEFQNFEHEFFSIAADDPHLQGAHIAETTQTKVTLRKPNTHNWGYDVPIHGSAATNPALLGSLRPDEMIDFVATLHNFSQGPIQVIYDLVYGHADNQCQDLINRQFLKGPNMYGQDLNHQLPTVRAILLEMQRRKINTGIDGIRVDGGQDFRWFNPMTGRVEQDDAYLLAMSDVVQEIEDCQRLLFTIFEDGRPWPQEGWEETSTYRDLIELRPESYQWGPLIFAHNTPVLEKFWDQKWQRVSEVMIHGEQWITGCANHDTVRRGNQIDPQSAINWNLGKTLPEVLHNGYDNPAIKLWVYGFSPGLPMDFINALMRAPWGFFRNTDDRYGVKVVSEEVGFLDWQVEPTAYQQPAAFIRLKALGFWDLEQLQQFAHSLRDAMLKTDYDLEAVAQICQRCINNGDTEVCEVPALQTLQKPQTEVFLNNLDVPALKTFAMAFMEDMHDFSNVSHVLEQVDLEQAQFGLILRQYRHAHPWLRHNLAGSDRFNRITDDQRTAFYGLRTAPSESTDSSPKQIAFVAHMGGDPLTVTLGDWLQLDLNEWKVAIATPGLEADQIADLRCFELTDSQGLLLERVE